jgi:hypothetical protein
MVPGFARSHFRYRVAIVVVVIGELSRDIRWQRAANVDISTLFET